MPRPAQRTQRATLDWSHDLLAAPTRRLFAAVSVFAGGWTLEAAEQVCGGVVGEELSVLRGLTELVEASLVRTTEADGQVRYSMHRVTREYAAERLAATSELADVERRHAEWVRELVETAEPHLVLRDLRAWQDRLKVEEDNLRRALRWTIDHQETDLGLLIGGACWRFWFHWATMREGVAWLEELLALPGARLGPGRGPAHCVPRRAVVAPGPPWIARRLPRGRRHPAVAGDRRRAARRRPRRCRLGRHAHGGPGPRFPPDRGEVALPAPSPHSHVGRMDQPERWSLRGGRLVPGMSPVDRRPRGDPRRRRSSDQALFAAHVRATVAGHQYGG